MELGASLKALGDGEFQNAFNYLWTPRGEIEQSQKTTAGLIAANQALALKGTISSDEAIRRAGIISYTSSYPFLFDNPDLSPAIGFGEGLQEGANNIKAAASTGINFTLGAIPPQIWIALGIAAFFYLLPYFAPRPR